MTNLTLRQRIDMRRNMPPPEERRRLRQLHGLTLDHIAAEIPVTKHAVATWEAGSRNPRGENLVRYAEVLQLLRASAEMASRPDGDAAT